ncbi:MAG: AAA family ATPase, partial [Acidimicrobiales bacterium]
MRITRLYLRNYRVYEDELDLELPAGLVGIVGPNGAGKSALLESILWTLYGYSRTSKEEVRTAEVNAECVTEVAFEHEDHHYLVRRTIAGINSTVRAQAEADGAQVAEGVQAVRAYVHSVLGMDAGAFRASVFAEQKQLASFSTLRPSERKDLVLRLLGVTPLDHARDQARRDARAAADAVDRLRQVLPDLEALAVEVDDSAAAASARAVEVAAEQAAAASALAALDVTQRRLAQVEVARREHDALVAEGRAVRAQHDAAAEELRRLDAELAGLSELTAALPDAEVAAAGLEAAERLLVHVEAAAGTARALAALPGLVALEGPDEAACEQALDAARQEAETVAGRLAALGGRLRGAQDAEQRCAQAMARSAELSGEAGCPLCGQDLGDAFAQVQAHRAAEVAEAAATRAALRAEYD